MPVVSGRLTPSAHKLLAAFSYFVVSGRLTPSAHKLLAAFSYFVVSGRLELPTSTLSV